MKTSRFSDGQTMGVLKQAETGVPVPELCREHGISSASFYKWRAKYGGMDASLMAEMKTAVKEQGVSIALACRAFGISEACYRYRPKLGDENAEIADRLLRLTATHRAWGFGLCFLYLRNIAGFGWNHHMA